MRHLFCHRRAAAQHCISGDSLNQWDKAILYICTFIIYNHVHLSNIGYNNHGGIVDTVPLRREAGTSGWGVLIDHTPYCLDVISRAGRIKLLITRVLGTALVLSEIPRISGYV